MSVGHDFPIIGPGAWWVIPEGLTGQAFSLVTGRFTRYTTVQSHTRPRGAVAGPYSTQAQAQTKASSLTSSFIPGPATPAQALSDATNIPGINAVGDLAHRLTDSQTWIRVGEFLAGLILLYVGAKAFFPTTVNNVTSHAKAIGKGVATGVI